MELSFFFSQFIFLFSLLDLTESNGVSNCLTACFMSDWTYCKLLFPRIPFFSQVFTKSYYILAVSVYWRFSIFFQNLKVTYFLQSREPIFLGPTESAEKMKNSNLVHVMEKHFIFMKIIFLFELVMLTTTTPADCIRILANMIWYLLGESLILCR